MIPVHGRVCYRSTHKTKGASDLGSIQTQTLNDALNQTWFKIRENLI